MDFRITIFAILGFLPFVSNNCEQSNTSNMLTYEEAKKSAIDTIAIVTKQDVDVVLWEEKTIVKQYGWYFVFTTKKYIETRSPKHIKFGVPCVFVNKNGKELNLVPTSIPLEKYILLYEEKNKDK
jgi:Immunity protein 35